MKTRLRGKNEVERKERRRAENEQINRKESMARLLSFFRGPLFTGALPSFVCFSFERDADRPIAPLVSPQRNQQRKRGEERAGDAGKKSLGDDARMENFF